MNQGTPARALLWLAAAAAACSSRGPTPSGGEQGSGGTAVKPPSMDGGNMTQPPGPNSDSDPLLDQVKQTVPGAVSTVAVPLGIAGLRSYWVSISSGPPDRGVGVITADDRTFFKGKDAFRRVLDTKTTDPVALARAALLLLERGGDPVVAVSDLPAGAQADARGTTITPPSVTGDLLRYWSYYHKVGQPELARSDVNLKTFEVKWVYPGDGGDPVAKAAARLTSTDPNTRRSAVEALVAACNDAAAAALVQTIASNPHADTRALAARFLPKCPSKTAAVTLITALGKDADASVREWAAASLGVLKDTSARAALEKAARDDASENVRIVAGMALKKL